MALTWVGSFGRYINGRSALSRFKSLESPRVGAIARNRRPRHRPHLISRPRTCSVQGATVIPDDNVALGPVVAIDEARAGAVLKEAAQ